MSMQVRTVISTTKAEALDQNSQPPVQNALATQPLGSEIDPLVQEMMDRFQFTNEEAELHLRCLA